MKVAKLRGLLSLLRGLRKISVSTVAAQRGPRVPRSWVQTTALPQATKLMAPNCKSFGPVALDQCPSTDVRTS